MSDTIKNQKNELKDKAINEDDLENVSGGVEGAWYPNCGQKGCYGCDGRILHNCPKSTY